MTAAQQVRFWLIVACIAAVAALTLVSIAAYVREWVRHMGSPRAN